METYDPYIQKAIVNGLIATIILWGFWTPFILAVVIGLVNNQIKDGICGASQNIAYSYQDLIYNFIWYMHKTFNIPGWDWGNLDKPFNDTTAQNEINQDPSVVSSINKPLTVIMIVTCIAIILISIVLVRFLVYRYNLDGWSIFRFNLLMAIIIMIIEASFFGGVAARYIPFYPPDMLRDLREKIEDYVKSMTGQ